MAATATIGALAQFQGVSLLSAGEAIVKGALESEIEVGLIIGPQSPAFSGVFRRRGDDAAVIRAHGIRMLQTLDVARAVHLAVQSVRAKRSAIVLVPNALIDDSMRALAHAASISSADATLCLVMEDDPAASPATCPRQAASRVGITCMEVGDVAGVREGVDHALRLGASAECPMALVVHRSVLLSLDTIPMRPNRHSEHIQAALARRTLRRGGRAMESQDALRVGRRMELNRFLAMPIKGERVPAGFITVGPAHESLQHLVDVLGLYGRVPILNLRMLSPMDDAAVMRMLARCEDVLVLEPRPGTVEAGVAAIADAMRRRGEPAGWVWGHRIPPDASGVSQTISTNEVVHPSTLVRRVLHVLHRIRPGGQVADRLTDAPSIAAVPPPRPPAESALNRLQHTLRRMLADVDQWLREQAAKGDRDIEPTSLAIDGVMTGQGTSRVVKVEIWMAERFEREGVAAIAQAAAEPGAGVWILLEDRERSPVDLERLARAILPEGSLKRARVETANIHDRTAMRESLERIVLEDAFTVLVVRESGAQTPASAIEATLEEVDRLGYRPTERIVQAADLACIPGSAPPAITSDSDELPPSAMVMLAQEDAPGRRWRLRVQVMREQITVVRKAPPVPEWVRQRDQRVPLPTPLHGRQPAWRAHVAGLRGEWPGAAGIMLLEAGRAMGYATRSISDPSSLGRGMHAWTQVLFTKPREPTESNRWSATIPYGEADLLLALEPHEALRAVHPSSRLQVASPATCAVLNRPERDVSQDQDESNDEVALDAVAAIVHAERRFVMNFESTCRLEFHSERLADMAMLGVAYQQGYLPISLEAAEAGLAAAESRGFGRCRLAFDHGRRIAAGLIHHVVGAEADHLTVARLVEERARLVRSNGFLGRRMARALRTIIQKCLDAMPGLHESESGRSACMHCVDALSRSMLWGGAREAQRLADLVMRLYAVDRGETGRAVTRMAIPVLADVTLIRDTVYVCTMLSSAEHRRSLRRALDVRRGRGDEVAIRYQSRVQAAGFGRRIRADIRTSDWPVRLVSALGQVVPRNWRGSRVDRERREYVLGLANRAITENLSNYDQWLGIFSRLHQQVAEDRLKDMSIGEVRMLAEPAMPGVVSAAAQL